MSRAILRAASLLVPSDLRAEWLDEWRGELWHVARSGRRPAAFAIGAFRDAFWLRRNSPAAPFAFSPASPLHCIAILAALAATTFVCAPRPRAAPIPGLLTISAAGHGPSVSYESYRGITAHASRAFSGLAFAAPARARVQFAPGRAAEVSLALATPSLADLVGVPTPPRDEPAVLLADGAWRAWFAAIPTCPAASSRSAAAPLASPESCRSTYSGGSGRRLDAHRGGAAGGPEGLRSRESQSAVQARRALVDVRPNRRGAWDRFECASLDGESPVSLSVAMMLLALLLLPISTPVRLGRYPTTPHSPRGVIRRRRWCFLGLKLAFLVPAVYWGAQMAGSLLAPGLEAHGCLIGYSFAFRWILIDQRRRCPVCLRLLTNPTPIGCPSQTFLDWYGTELICGRGHGLLHVPEILTSCYSSPRWLYLDRSWSSLFSAGARGSIS